MAILDALKLRWFLYIAVLFLALFLFNKVIVMHYMTDVGRSQFLRFQTSCFLQSIYSFISGYVWFSLSRILEPRTTDDASFRRYFSLRSSSFESKLWKISLAFILISSSGIYPSFSFFISTNPYMVSFWIGVCWALQILLFTGVLLVKIACFLVRLTRRNKVGRAIIVKLHVLVIICSVIVTIFGFYNAIRPPQIKEIQIPVKQLPTELDGMTITLITDIHLGPTAGKEHLDKVIHTVNYLQSDLVIIGGDLVDGRVDQLQGSFDSLEWIDPKYGVYFVTGNHEYYTSDVHKWFVELEAKGVKLLHNSHVWLPSSDRKGVCLAGVDDPQGRVYKFMDHKMDLDKALAPCGNSHPVILVSHRPEGAKAAFDSDHRVDLVLAGHTHGGQMFPISVGAYFGNPYYAGLYKHGDSSHVYVSMGTRFWGFPVRIGTRAEITKITLISAQ